MTDLAKFLGQFANYVIAILADKGGVGKSTLGCNLLCWIAKIEPSVVLIDCDSDQHSSAKLASRRIANGIEPSLNIVNIRSSELQQKVSELSKKYKIIIVEFGKAIGDMGEEERTKAVRIAAKIADKIIMPLQPTSFDTETIEAIENKLMSLQAAKIPALIVPNRVMSQRQLSGLVTSEPYLKYFKISKAYMENRLCYQEVHESGKTIFDIKPKTNSEKNAFNESTQLFQEIIFYGN